MSNASATFVHNGKMGRTVKMLLIDYSQAIKPRFWLGY